MVVLKRRLNPLLRQYIHAGPESTRDLIECDNRGTKGSDWVIWSPENQYQTSTLSTRKILIKTKKWMIPAAPSCWRLHRFHESEQAWHTHSYYEPEPWTAQILTQQTSKNNSFAVLLYRQDKVRLLPRKDHKPPTDHGRTLKCKTTKN